MVLVDRRGLTRQALPAVAASRAVAKKQRRHRVIIESVGHEQKKLKTTISFQARPPNGYTFIPAGNPELTNALKEASREASQQIYAVSASPHAQVHDLSKEVHRIGFHFPTIIVDQVCSQYGITLTSKGEVAKDNEDTFRQMRQKGGWNNGTTNDKKKDQKTVNTEARDAIKDLFPKIPQDDLFTIIKGAFQKGQKKVGTANELPLVRRAQLSVVAHVRHVYTKYDKLLRTVGYREARSQVEGPTLRKLVEWRGDDDNTTKGNQVLEDVMREVIVLSDDEDSDNDDDEVVEVSTRAKGWPLPSHHSVPDARPVSPEQYEYQSSDENFSGYRVVAQPPRRRLVDTTSQPGPSTQYRQSRYAAWDRAREEYRANPSAVPTALVPLSQHDPKFYYTEPDFRFNDPPARVRQDPVGARQPEHYSGYTNTQVMHDQRPMPNELVHGADGYLYQRIYTPAQPGLEPQRRHEVPLGYVSSEPPSPHHAAFHEEHDFSGQAVNSRILPSIEDNQPLPQKHGRSRASQYGYSTNQPTGRTKNQIQSNERPRNVPIIDLTDGTHTQIAKRRRLVEPASPRRAANDFHDHRRALDNAVLREGQESREVNHYGREIIDLSSPRYLHDPLLGSPRMVPKRRPVDSRMEEVEGTHSDARASRPLVGGVHNAPTTRYTYGPEPMQHHDQSFGFLPPLSKIRRAGQIAHGLERQYVHQSDAEYPPQDPAIRSEHLVARHDTNHREVLVPAGRVPVRDAGSFSYSREYVPVIRNEALMPQSQPIYVDSPRGPQHDRYERIPPQTNVRN